MTTSSPARRSAGLKASAIVLIIIALISTGLWLWRSARTSDGGWQGGAPVDVVTQRLVAQDAPVTLQALGELRAARQVVLSVEAAGRVSEIAFEPGEQAERGQLLASLDDAVEQADLIAARSRQTFAKEQLERARTLAESGAMSRELLQQRQAEYDDSRSRVALLQAQIAQKHVRAPFAGQLGIRHIDLGQYLNPGDRAVSLTDLSELQVNFEVPQQELARVRLGQTVRVDTGLAGVEPATATITAIEPQVAEDTRNAALQATLKSPGEQWLPGMYASVEVTLPAEPDALLVPATALVTSASGNLAVVVREVDDQGIGQSEQVPVTVSRYIGEQAVIVSGLAAGELVVTEGQLRIQPGASVHVVDQGGEQ
ncbi:MAG TPA: efflux transporter periplasmic adaptor subunit [Pseudomonas sp.]|nr:efflux transporter periplasmic adaptor subunit [Pseudomonas sp.]MBB51855.1 efflux transporter periplasmic adaptor subunit [Pseudomonadales bacterium]MBB52346.1 efflux transporter periplasmic adaptor subunit [Pseudomonadales bacterium]HCA25618.1 efflux transporter periplasmic adaptor subunit [Pseudomonas sp.]|tara:strand:+ start:5756 stop:6865 length:1110 start_codon:yes stop_codon:yes gene_type:complete